MYVILYATKIGAFIVKIVELFFFKIAERGMRFASLSLRLACAAPYVRRGCALLVYSAVLRHTVEIELDRHNLKHFFQMTTTLR